MISVRATFKRKFIAGIIVSIPALVSILVIAWAFRTIDNFLSPAYESVFHHHIYGLGFLSAVCIILMLGIVSTNVIGKKVIRAIERSLMNVPLLKSVYSPIKSVMDAFSNSASFKKFVIIEYPRSGAFAFGFLTKEHAVKMHKDGTTQELVAVYIPTNNLYLGEVALFRKEDVFYTGIPVEDGVKIVLSGGIATPNIMKETINDCNPEKLT